MKKENTKLSKDLLLGLAQELIEHSENVLYDEIDELVDGEEEFDEFEKEAEFFIADFLTPLLEEAVYTYLNYEKEQK